MPLNLDTYFAQDVDERQVQTSFNFAPAAMHGG